MQFLSTPSARRATVFGVRLMILMVISIHALRKEGDSSLELAKQMTENFYPRPPQGGRPGQAPASVCGRMISIHALRKEGDAEKLEINIGTMQFLSTPSARRATDGDTASIRLLGISIHALRKEGDMSWPLMPLARLYFYPRPPQGGRRRMNPPPL